MFFVVSGVGHCGTAWLASILDRPDEGMICFHEHKYTSLPWLSKAEFGWEASLKHELAAGLDPSFDQYFDSVNEARGRFACVGDSHSWEPFLLPVVHARTPIDRVIHLVRNGIPNVHSLYYHNAWIPRSGWIYSNFFRHYWELLGKPFRPYERFTDWACWCLWWHSNAWAAHYLESQFGPEGCQIYRFEDLLSDAPTLAALISGLNESSRPSLRELRVHQGDDINRKIDGDRSPEHLWRQWTDEQRDVFTEICGETMSRFGYSIPLRP